MPRTSNDAVAISADLISALVDPDLAPYLPGTLPPHLPAGTLTVDLVRSVDDQLQSGPVPLSASVELITGPDGSRLALRRHEREGDGVIVWIHGGGLYLGRADRDDLVCAALAEVHRTTVVAVDYRLAPEHPYPAALEDCCAALAWCGQRYERVIVAGESAGGGLAAALTLLARVRGAPDVTAQVLHYPMLDDRGETISARTLADAPVWNRALNELGGLPPTYLEVGALDLFRDEVIAFGTALTAAGVPTELHVDAATVHGFDRIAPDAAISQVARERRARFVRRYFAADAAQQHTNGAQ